MYLLGKGRKKVSVKNGWEAEVFTHADSPSTDRDIARQWAVVGIITGLIACVTYPLSIFVPFPSPRITLVVAGSFGPALAIACIALGRVLQLKRRSIFADLGAASNALAGALVTAMILVQLAVQQSTAPDADPELTRYLVRRIWDVILGLDVAFDMFIGLGTAFFGIAMLGDRRFGKVIGWIGIVIGLVVIIGFNMATFPEPPADAGLFDPGPLSGIWYLAVVVQMIRAVRAQRRQTADKELVPE
jgi:hypothetical protein